MTPAQITGSTFRGGLLRGVLAGAVALLVVYGVLFLTSSEQTATAQATCEQGAAVPDPSNNPGLVRDCAILLAAKDTLRGTATLDWSASTAVGDWTGITLAGTPPRVSRVVVTDAGLDGTIPATLGGLEELQQLNLGDNALTGTIPGELGGLSKLWLLHLAGNDLTGPLPAELVMIERLQILRVGGNRLTGEIPEALFGLTYLDYVDLSGNQLTGSIPPIPPIPANRFDMQGILLDGNQLSGPIPVGLGELNLTLLQLSGNPLTGCIPQGLRDVSLHDLDDLGLPDCTTTTTYDLTMSAGPNGRSSPPPGRYAYLNGSSVTVTAMPNEGYQVARWTGDCQPALTATTCTLTMDADKTARVRFARITRTLTVTAGEGGGVTHDGGATLYHGDEVTLTASWNDATHELSWGGDCAGTTISTCVLTMDANKNVTATFTALPATRCATPADADCVLAVYRGAPGDYAQVVDIPADVLLTANSDGRYYVERGQQYTVVTAAPLPAGWTRFWLEVSPLEFGTPSPISASQLIKPVGTTYTFTVTEDEAAPTLITFDLKQARPFVRPRPDNKPEIGDTVVTTTLWVVNCESGVAVTDPTTNTELFEDCKSLVKAKDRLAGTATLNWTAGRPMRQWTGVTIAGTPRRVTRLELANTGLTGEIPAEIGDLTALTELRLNDNQLTGRVPSKLSQLDHLTHIYVAGNSLTGCVPGVWADVANNDLETLALPYCGTALTYDTSDMAGTAMTAGTYAFTTDHPDLAEDSTVRVGTTHELVEAATRLVVNVTDGDGNSRAAFYESIKVGDVVEWLPTDETVCWQRFRVTAILPDPPGNPPRKHFAIENLARSIIECGGPLITDESELPTELRWNPPAARPGNDGIPTMLIDQPVQGGVTVRPAPFSPILIDIPSGMSLVRYTGWTFSNIGIFTLGLRDVQSGSYLILDLLTGDEQKRQIQTAAGDSRDIGALFDQVVASARLSSEGK